MLASRSGSTPTVVAAAVVSGTDVEKMAADAGKLLADNTLRREMGKRARESAISRYRTDLVIPQSLEFYNRVLAKKGK